MLGYEKDFLDGKKIRFLFPDNKEHNRVSKELFADLDAIGIPKVETKWLHQNGTIIDVLLHARPIDISNLGKGIIITALDFTERKQAEEALIDSKQALLDSNKRLLKAQHVARMGFLSWNLKTDRILLSEEIIYLYGLDPAKKWLTPDLVAQVVHPDDLNYVQSNLEMAVKGIKKYDIDHRVVRPDGTFFWVHAQAELACDEEGNPQDLLGTVVDITERKETEEKLNKIAKSLPDIIYIFDLVKNKNVYASKSLNKVLGYTPEEFEAMGDTVLGKLIHPDDLEPFMEYLEILKKVKGDEASEYEYRMKHKDGYWVWIQNRDIIFTRDSKGNPLQTIGTAADITERKKIEEKKRELEKQRKVLIETISHELRAPTTSIKGFVEVLRTKDDSFTQEQKENCFEIIDRNLTRLERLLNDVSELSKIERGVFVLQKQMVNLNDFLSDEVRAYTNLLGKQFGFNPWSFELPLFLEIDKERISQVLSNLINNAVRHTPPDTREIILTVKADDPKFVRIEISDNGAGIRSENLERIFGQFVSIKSKYKAGGTGIGLHVCRKIVNAHNGTIKAHSEGLDKGATFTVDLPIGSMEQSI